MQVEVEDAIGSIDPMPGGAAVTAEAGAGMTFAEKVTLAVISAMCSLLVGLGGYFLKRKRGEQVTEDSVWGTATATIARLQGELEALRKESELVRVQRNEFEASATRAENNSKIAAEAAMRASEAAQRNEAELIDLRHSWERAQRYIHILRSALSTNNLPIPPEPAGG